MRSTRLSVSKPRPDIYETIFIHLTGENIVTWPHLLQGSLANIVYLDSLVSGYNSVTTAEGEEDFGGQPAVSVKTGVFGETVCWGETVFCFNLYVFDH